MNKLQEAAINIIKQQGATVVEIEYMDKINANGDAEFDVLKYEFKYGILSLVSVSVLNAGKTNCTSSNENIEAIKVSKKDSARN